MGFTRPNDKWTGHWIKLITTYNWVHAELLKPSEESTLKHIIKITKYYQCVPYMKKIYHKNTTMITISAMSFLMLLPLSSSVSTAGEAINIKLDYSLTNEQSI